VWSGCAERIDSRDWKSRAKLRRVAYHEAFWVVVGTAAPVIALADVVLVGQLVATGSAEQNRPDRLDNLVFVVLAACFTSQLFLLLFALDSLATDSDAVSTWWAAATTTFGIFLLFAAGGFIALAPRARSAFARSAKRPAPCRAKTSLTRQLTGESLERLGVVGREDALVN
jgi:hypothetical protein